MKIKSLIVSAVLVTAILFFGAPSLVQGVTIEELQAQITSLMAQLQAMKAQQNNTGTSWCYTFNNNLKIGDAGLEIGQLRNALVTAGIYKAEIVNIPAADIEFSEEIASTVVEFQEKYASEILTPSGLRRGTGFVGKATRAKLNALYGCKTTCIPNWQCQWGTCVNGYQQQTPVDLNNCPLVSNTGACPTLARACTTTPSITVTSPNGGEQQQIGQTYKVMWTKQGGFPTDAGYVVTLLKGGQPLYGIASSFKFSGSPSTDSLGNQYYTWQIPNGYGIVTGSDYKVEVKMMTSDGLTQLVSDQSDNYFTITSDSVAPLSVEIKANGSSSPSSVPYKSQFTVSWTSVGADNCAAYGHYVPLADGSGYWTDLRNLSASGSKTLTADHKNYGYISSLQVGIQCFNNEKNTSVSKIVWVPVTASTTPSITATPTAGTLTGSSPTLWVNFVVNNYTPNKTEIIDFGDGIKSALGYTTDYNSRHDYHSAGTFNVKLLSGTTVIATTQVVVTASTTPSITVTSPNGGETWKVGETHNIKWTSSGLSSGYVELYYLEPSGNYKGIASYVSASAGSYQWTVPSSLSGQNSKIHIRPMGTFIGEDFSDNYFTIASASTISTCADSDGSNQYTKGSVSGKDAYGNAYTYYDECSGSGTQVNEMWCYESPSGSGKYVYGKMIYTCANGCDAGACKQTATCDFNYCSQTDGGDNLYLKGTDSYYDTNIDGTCGLKTQTDYCVDSNYLWEYNCRSSGRRLCANGCENGACKQSTTPSVTLTSPNGGETLRAGQTYTITWTGSNLPSDGYVYLTLRDKATNTSSAITMSALSTSQTQYSWTVPTEIDGSSYVVSVDVYKKSPFGKLVSDDSNAYFSISN